MVSRIAIAALAVLLAIGSADATCRYATCPGGFQSFTWGNLACPSCIRWPNNLQCPSLKEPYCCGGETGIICPAIACASSTSYAIAGAYGCSIAFSVVKATAISQSQYVKVVNDTANVLAAYCTAGYPDEAGWETAIAATASAAATAYAEAVAKAIYDYTIFVCDCGNCRQRYAGCNLAVSTVSAQIQAVATAQAYIYAQAIAQVKDMCWPVDVNGTLIAIAEANAEAFASSTALAVNSVLASASSNTASNCKFVCGSNTKKAVAKAVACGFVNVLASARDSCTPDVTRACTTTLALAGDAVIGTTCDLSYVCPSRKLKMM